MADRFRTGRIDWEDVRFFAALARHGSLSATARALTVNHATVARRLAALEQSLGTELFKRRPGGYELTTAGRTALEAADAMENAATALSRLEPEKALTGLVRITATPSLAETFLIPRLAAFQQQHPMLDLEIIAERHPVSLQRRQSDIALRLVRPEHGELMARHVTNIVYRFYATPAWHDRLRGGTAPCFVGFDEAGTQFPEASWLAMRFGDARMTLRSNDYIGQIAAARAGYGIALIPHFLAAGDSALVEVRLSETPPPRELWLLTRHDVRKTQRIRVVADLLFDLIHRERPLFEGM